MTDGEVRLEDSWKGPLGPEFSAPYMGELRRFLLSEKEAGKRIFPKGSEYFRALDLTPLDRVEVVILGRIPITGRGRRTASASASGRVPAFRRLSSTSTRNCRATSASRQPDMGFSRAGRA